MDILTKKITEIRIYNYLYNSYKIIYNVIRQKDGRKRKNRRNCKKDFSASDIFCSFAPWQHKFTNLKT